jgi:hypothetical protein
MGLWNKISDFVFSNASESSDTNEFPVITVGDNVSIQVQPSQVFEDASLSPLTPLQLHDLVADGAMTAGYSSFKGYNVFINGVQTAVTSKEDYFKKVDPYDEEDWDETNEAEKFGQYVKTHEFIPFTIRENIDNNFELENIEDYKKAKLSKNVDYLRVIKRLVIDKKVTYYSFSYITGKSTKITEFIRSVSFNAFGIVMFTSYKNEISAVDERREVVVEEIKKRIDESSNWLEIDPYGEENWENELNFFWKIEANKSIEYYEMIFYRLVKILNKKFNQKLVGNFPEFELKCFIDNMYNFFYIRYKSTKKYSPMYGS